MGKVGSALYSLHGCSQVQPITLTKADTPGGSSTPKWHADMINAIINNTVSDRSKCLHRDCSIDR